jgi:hypothetical protein
MTTNPAAPLWPAPRMAATAQLRAGRASVPQVFSRIIATLAVALAVAHVWIMMVFPHGPWVGTALVVMVLLCLKCTHRARSNPAALLELLAMSALMAIVHTFMALGIHEHRHGSDDAVSAAGAGASAMLGLAAAELVLVMLCGVGMRLAAFRAGAGAGAGAGGYRAHL